VIEFPVSDPSPAASPPPELPARPPLDFPVALLTNGLIFGIIALLWVIEARDRYDYLALVQEDGMLEWATVVLLLPAAWLCTVGFRRQKQGGGPFPWFLVGLGAFCLFFAGEEISWGQRLMAYQPPEFFLEKNSQQELNLHNIFKHIVRTKPLLMAILAVWGVALPLLDRWLPPARRLFARLGFIIPPAFLVPAFAADYALLDVYEWRNTGEVGEMLFALLLLFVIAVRVSEPANEPPRLAVQYQLALIVAMAAAVSAVVPPALAVLVRGSDEERVELAEAEVSALVADWFAHADKEGEGPSKCRTHIRLYTWVRKHDLEVFTAGEFAGLGIDETRREYFLDPWNNPYWIRHVCRKDGTTRRMFVYSFGPDRRRESTKKELLGDDIGEKFKARP